MADYEPVGPTIDTKSYPAGLTINTTAQDSEKNAAEAAYRWAQAAYFTAQADGQKIDNRTAEALAKSAEIALAREQLKDSWDAASNGRNRVYHFTEEVRVEAVDSAIDVLNRWQRLDKDNQNPYRFVICSPGGAAIPGMKLYSTLKAIALTRPLITIASGFCASMATVLHQAGTTRVIEPGCSYMIHDVSGKVDGGLHDMQDQMDWLTKLNKHVHHVLAERSKLTVDEVAAQSKRRDCWYMPDEAIELGFADEIGYAS
jgi:ATP-dependent Clp protease protease subunit